MDGDGKWTPHRKKKTLKSKKRKKFVSNCRWMKRASRERIFGYDLSQWPISSAAQWKIHAASRGRTKQRTRREWEWVGGGGGGTVKEPLYLRTKLHVTVIKSLTPTHPTPLVVLSGHVSWLKIERDHEKKREKYRSLCGLLAKKCQTHAPMAHFHVFSFTPLNIRKKILRDSRWKIDY